MLNKLGSRHLTAASNSAVALARLFLPWLHGLWMLFHFPVSQAKPSTRIQIPAGYNRNACSALRLRMSPIVNRLQIPQRHLRVLLRRR